MKYLKDYVNTDNENELEKITPWYILTILKPILADELVAKLRSDNFGIRVNFNNGQKFRIRVEEIK